MKTYEAITGKLKARTAIHIGSGEERDATDGLCRRSAEGKYIIPGTAICGALRSIAVRLAPRLGADVCYSLRTENRINKDQPCGCLVCQLFGDVNPTEGETEAKGGRASRLLVAHAEAVLPEKRTARIRDGVGIDRTSKTSARAASVKFDLEVLPKGTGFSLRLELEDLSEEQKQLLTATLAEWKAGRAWLGGGVARGLGAFDLSEVKIASFDMTSDDGLMAFLESNEPWIINTKNAEEWLNESLGECNTISREDLSEDVKAFVSSSFVIAKFDLKITELFLSNDTTAAVRSGFDHAPLLDVMSKEGKPILTGSSLRGSVRSHAERIARTLITLESNSKDEFLAKCPACNPVENNKDENVIMPLENCDTRIRKASKNYEDEKTNPYTDEKETQKKHLCLACRLFGSTRRGSRLIVEDAETGEPLQKKTVEGKDYWQAKVLDFLAIDRFTGGGKDGAKFDALAAWQPTFSVRLHLENPREWELGWLALVLRDMSDEMLTVGFGAAKGFGRAKLDKLNVEYGFIGDEDFFGPTDKAAFMTERSSGLYRVLSWDVKDDTQKNELLDIAYEWVNEFNKKCKNFSLEEDLRPQADTYFTGEVHNLYPKEAYQWQTQ